MKRSISRILARIVPWLVALVALAWLSPVFRSPRPAHEIVPATDEFNLISHEGFLLFLSHLGEKRKCVVQFAFVDLPGDQEFHNLYPFVPCLADAFTASRELEKPATVF